jgi:beta-glucosidase
MIAIQWEDVIGVLQTCKPYLIALGVLWIAAVVVMIVCMKVKKKSKKRMIRKYSALSMLVSLVVIVNMIVLGPMYAMINLTTVGGTTSNETTEEAKEVAGQIAEEGMVLLKNDGILPISDPSNINLFGWSSVNPAYGGTGSGGLNDLYEKVSLIDSLTDAGFNVNQELVDFYNEFSAERAEMSLSTQNWTLTEAPASAYSDELLQSAKDFSDTAAIVLSRVAGEGHNDMPKDVTQASYDNTANGYEDFAAGEHYLQLSQTEEDLVNLVCSNFDNVIVLYNSANPMELGFVEQYDQIKAALWCQGPGNVGFEALGKILTGEVNPSGRTSDTFIYNMAAAPWWNNWEATRYSNMEDMAVEGMNSGMAQTYYPSFTNYVEGIYVGYKYYETADDDGKIDYDATVQYPFGYGLSYTTFTQEMSNLTVKDGEITFDVTVTNTGDVAGKDVVEIYYNPPYTNGGIEKATANLIDFEKTQTLEPGASETITITFDAEDMASYDMSGDGCYVLEQGDYAISVNSDSHTVLDQQIYTQDETVRYEGDNKRESDQIAATNQFEDVAGDVTYLSRADGFANYDEATAAPASDVLSNDLMAQYHLNSNFDYKTYINEDSIWMWLSINPGAAYLPSASITFTPSYSPIPAI